MTMNGNSIILELGIRFVQSVDWLWETGSLMWDRSGEHLAMIRFAHLLTTYKLNEYQFHFIFQSNPPTQRHQNDLKVLLKNFVVTHNPQLIQTNLLHVKIREKFLPFQLVSKTGFYLLKLYNKLYKETIWIGTIFQLHVWLVAVLALCSQLFIKFSWLWVSMLNISIVSL